MDIFRLIAERKIREAQEEGAFDFLEGTGQPLDLSENPFEDPAQRMGHRLLRNNGFAPAWIEEGRELRAAIADYRAREARLAPGERARQSRDLNRRIGAHNLRVPCARCQILPVFSFSSPDNTCYPPA